MQDNAEKVMYLKGMIGQPLQGITLETDANNVELHFRSAVLIVSLDDLFISIPERVNDKDSFDKPDTSYEPLC
jgi:hypothetical protein